MDLAPTKFLIFPALQLLAIAIVMLDVNLVWIAPAIFAALALLCDFIADRSDVDDLSDLERWGSPILYVSAAAQFLLVLVLFLALRNSGSSPVAIVGAMLTLGVFNGAAGGHLSHEIMHRVGKLDAFLSRALSSMALHSTFTIDHLHTHHVHAARRDDPASAQRGQVFWSFAVRSYLASNSNAAKAESDRLSRQNKAVWSPHNRFLAGHLFELLYLFAAGAIAGLPGLLAAIGGGLISIVLIESFNYIAHFGLIRTDTGRFEARHSWSTRRVISSGFTFNITQHAQHHLYPGRPYWQIEAQHDMPILPLGVGALSFLALFPPLWFRFMQPHLDRWDAEFASREELLLRRQR